MGDCSRAGCAVCSSCSTGHLTDPFWGHPKADPYFWRSSTSHVHFHSPSGRARWGSQAPGRRRALHPSEVSQAVGGSVPVTAAPRLSLHNLPVTSDPFRCQMGFVSLGRALPPPR